VKQLFVLVFAVCLGVLTTSPALAETTDWTQPESLVCSLDLAFESPQDFFFPQLEKDNSLLPLPQSWYPPPAECIPNLACSIPRDCPGGECYHFGFYGPLDRRCVCPYPW